MFAWTETESSSTSVVFQFTGPHIESSGGRSVGASLAHTWNAKSEEPTRVSRPHPPLRVHSERGIQALPLACQVLAN
jgi:hypothetical protein